VAAGRKIETMIIRRIMLVLSAIAMVMVMQALVGAPPARALSTTPDDTWMTNGKVYATALSEDGSTLYIGGKFTRVRENPPGMEGLSRRVSNLAAINLEDGKALRWKPQVTGDGAVVHSLAVKDGRVFIGGNFTAVGGEPRKNLAAVDATDGSVDPFAPQVGGATSYVYALLADDSKLYIGGGFKKVDGQPRGHLAAFVLATGTLDSTWTPKANGKVRDLEFAKRASTERPSIFVAGAFSSITGSDGTEDLRQSVARVYADTGDLHPWEIPSGTIIGPQTGWDLTATPTMLYGGFGAGPNYLAAFHITPANPLLDGTQAWRFNTVGNVQTVALSADGSRLFFGGHFGIARLRQSVCGGTHNLRGLASVNPLTGRIYCDWLPSIEGRDPNYDGPWALTTTDAHLWVGGGFTGISGVEQRNLARFTL
jgi:outer membrane protein assembly factor BamB